MTNPPTHQESFDPIPGCSVCLAYTEGHEYLTHSWLGAPVLGYQITRKWVFHSTSPPPLG